MSTNQFKYDVFLSYSNKNRDVVRDLASRLRSDGIKVWFDEWQIRPGDSIPAKIEDGLEHSRVLVLCLSAEALAADWPQLESHTFRFKDPLNHNRRLIPLRLDDTPTKGSLARFSYIDWRRDAREQEYPKLVEACSQTTRSVPLDSDREAAGEHSPERGLQLDCEGSQINALAFSSDGRRSITGSNDGVVRIWDTLTGECLQVLEGHSASIWDLAWSADEQRALSAAKDTTVRSWDIAAGQCIKVLEGHTDWVFSVTWSPDERFALSGSRDQTLRLWDLETGHCKRTLEGHSGTAYGVAWSFGPRFVVSCSGDSTNRIWELDTGRNVHVLEGHTSHNYCVAMSGDGRYVLSGGSSPDNTVRLWETKTGRCLYVLKGHNGCIYGIAWHHGNRIALSGSQDKTIRVWDVVTGTCLTVLRGHTAGVRDVGWSKDGRRAFSGDKRGGICVWDLSTFVTDLNVPKAATTVPPQRSQQVQYTNAKVLLVGNSAAGKTGLSNRLALDTYKETDSTVGAWATQWKLPLPEGDDVAGDSTRPSDQDGLRQDATATNVEREVWLWDFGGQADQRLIHQLYMDQTQVAALVFDPQKDDVFETLGQWDRDLSRADKDKADRSESPGGARMTKLLVAGRCDAGGLRVARRQVDDFVAERGYAAYLETSAKTSAGCAELKQAIIDGICWENIPWRSSPLLFKRLKDEIIQLKDESIKTGSGALLRINELREVLSAHMQADQPRFTDAELRAVVGLLAGPGVVWELEFGSWVLLQPELINAYAQSVIQTIRKDKFDRGCIFEEQVLKGELRFPPDLKRLDADHERILLLAMHQIIVERGLCIRYMTEEGKILLIFPSYYRRDRSTPVTDPTVQVSYQFNGFLDEIYSTLVVKLHHTREFEHNKLWKYGADFKTQDGKSGLGLRLVRRGDGEGELQVYFEDDVPVGDRIIFSKYIHEHLLHSANDVVRLRHYVCPHCGTPSGNREAAMNLLEQGKKDIPCVVCDNAKKRIPLWDELEKLFADPETKRKVDEIDAAARIVLDNTSKERLLVGEVISTVALAGQLCEEFNVDHGNDMEITFRNDAGKATGRKVYLQLKSGDSYLTKRKRDNAEIFKIPKKRHVEFWMDQAFPVILVIRTSDGRIRWMEIRDHLREITNNGDKQVRQIEFVGQRFDVMSIRRWRDSALGSADA